MGGEAQFFVLDIADFFERIKDNPYPERCLSKDKRLSLRRIILVVPSDGLGIG